MKPKKSNPFYPQTNGAIRSPTGIPISSSEVELSGGNRKSSLPTTDSFSFGKKKDPFAAETRRESYSKNGGDQNESFANFDNANIYTNVSPAPGMYFY